ncbi:MAG: hypothetical protein WC789_05730 [Lentisphaeria bacterium]|jgi:hypothetical protein
MKLANVNLEMSLKPFTDTAAATQEAVLDRLFRQWRELTDRAEAVSVMLWAADGSEILDYNRNPAATFEWAKWIGVANPRWGGTSPSDPEGLGIHKHPYPYMENPPEFTYAWLKGLVGKIKARTATLGKPVRVIATFDPGPEFAKSAFKYERHPEICLCRWGGAPSFVCCYATLNADTRAYASYPNGIPQGEPFGRFLGRQAQLFLSDMGFDAIWLSNGFGFGLESWSYTGALFDGKSFSNARAPETRKRILDFWTEFTAACAFPVHCRGSNFPTGVDVASDGVPIREIYRTFKPLPPPNSPWAAMDGDFGIELGGWMAHIAEVPDDRSYQFRFYLHDPWFKNSPWLDRYHRESHDIFLPLTIARLDATGAIRTPDHLSLLTVDDAFGRMPDQVPLEVVPKLLEALATAPDSPGPLVWVYPFDEIHDQVAAGRGLDAIFFGDWFVCGAINHGLPLNTVVSSANFVKTLREKPDLYKASILFAPCGTLSDECAAAIAAFVSGGGRAMLYGPLAGAPERLRSLIGLAPAPPLSGDFTFISSLELDAVAAGAIPATFHHDPLVSGGGLDAMAGDAATTVLASAAQGSQTRVIAATRALPAWKGGRAVWLRGTVSGKAGEGGQHLAPRDPALNFHLERLPGLLLAEFGWTIRFEKREWGARCPITLIARHDNALHFAGFTPDLTAGIRLKTPLGAPIFTGTETVLRAGYACYRLPRSWHEECRVFVAQDDGFVAAGESTAEEICLRRQILVKGLKGATVRFLPETGKAAKVRFLRNPQHPFLGGDWADARPVATTDGDCLEVENVTGELMIQILA